MNQKKISYNKLDYFTTFILIGFSGISFFTQSRTIFLAIVVILAFRFLMRPRFENFFIAIILSQILLSLLQAIQIGNYSSSSFVGNLLIWIFPYFVFLEIKDKFFPIFIIIMYWLTILSLIIWSLLFFYPGLNDFLKFLSQTFDLDPASNESLIFYNVETHRLFGFAFRNAGPFNESGSFGVFLILALFFNLLYEGGEKLFSKKNSVFIIGLLTTGSTGSYLALGSFLILYYTIMKKKAISVLIIPLIVLFSFWAYTSIGFLQEKIESQATTQLESKNLYNKGRLGTAIADLDQVKKHPIGGVGIYKENRIYDETDKRNLKGGSLMGIPAILARYGIPFAIIYLFAQILGLRKLALDQGYTDWMIVFMGFALIQITWLGQSPYIKPVSIYLTYFGLQYFLNKRRNSTVKKIKLRY
jgi:hypothetical protein